MRARTDGAWRGAAELFVVQVAVGMTALGLSMLTPWRLASALPITVLSTLLGAWMWAARVGRARDQLGRVAVRALAWRTGVGLGMLGAVAHALVAEGLPLLGWLAISGALGLGAMSAGTILTLCGLDMGRPRSAPRPPHRESAPRHRGGRGRTRGESY